MCNWNAFLRATAVIVAVSLVVAPLPDAAARADRPAIQLQANDRPTRQDLAAARVAAKAIGGPVAIGDMTTETDSAVANTDGTVTWEHRFRPMRIMRRGAWVPADSTLEVRADGLVAPRATAVDVTFSGGGGGPMVTLRRGSQWLSLGSPVGALPPPVLDGASATFESVLPGVDLLLKSDVDGFAQLLRVHDAAAAANSRLASLTFAVAGEGLSVKADAAGNLRVINDVGAQVFQGGAPQMWDAGAELHVGQGMPISPGVATGTHSAGAPRRVRIPVRIGPSELNVVPDHDMLTDPDTRWPLYIDPSLTINRSSWTMVQSGFPTTSFWNSTEEAKVGNASPGGTHRSFFNLDLGSSPLRGTHIVSSRLRLTQTHTSSCSVMSGGVVLWSTSGAMSSTTWNNQPTWHSSQSSTNQRAPSRVPATTAHRNAVRIEASCQIVREPKTCVPKSEIRWNRRIQLRRAAGAVARVSSAK